MSTEPVIKFEPILPPMPMILADASFLRTLTEVEAQVVAVKIVDAQSAQHAANLQGRLTAAGKKLDETRLAFKRPYMDISRAIDEVAKPAADRIEEAKKKLRHAQIQWDIDQRRMRDEAEAARVKELERLEALRVAEAKEAQRKADELAKAAAEAQKGKPEPEMMDVDFGDEPTPPPAPPKTEIEKQIEAVKFTPAPVIQRPAGLMYRASMRHSVKDISKLPDSFVNKTANDTAIRQVFCNGWKDGDPHPVCPGVVFFVEREAVSTGKAVF